MTKKIKYLIALNIVLLGLISLSLQQSRTSSTLDQMATAFAVMDTAELAALKIGSLALRREQGNAWSVNGKYLASPQRMDQLLEMLPQIEVKRPAPQHLMDSILNAFEEKSFMLEAYGLDGVLKQYPMLFYQGETYAMLEEDSPFALYIPGNREELAPWLSAGNEGAWRDKHILYATWRTLKRLEIEIPQRPEQNLEIYFDKDFYTVKGVDQLDSLALYNYVSQYVQFEAIGFAQGIDKDHGLLQSQPAGILRIEDLSRKEPAELHIYPVKDTIYGWLPQEEEAVVLDPDQLSRILLPPAAFQRREP